MKWIKVEEQLPFNTDLIVIIYKSPPYARGHIAVGRYFENLKYNWRFTGMEDGFEVTHWMPLPEMPE